jgi:hypothetical protein
LQKLKIFTSSGLGYHCALKKIHFGIIKYEVKNGGAEFKPMPLFDFFG